jgi:hypothetical protein
MRIVRKLLHPAAQLRRMHTQILRRLCIRHAQISDQAHRLKKSRLSMIHLQFHQNT